jgi:hypothetical protein
MTSALSALYSRQQAKPLCIALSHSVPTCADMCCPAGQAVLALPLKNAELSVQLPPGLQLAATAAGHLDCRMQLLSLHMDWPPAGMQTC